jgi:hypothetical protein
MSIRVRVDENFATGGVDIWVVDKGDGRRDLLRPDGQWERVTDLATTQLTAEPSVRLPEYVARPLLDALVRFYDGAEDTRNLRRDYDAERARVDRLIGALLTPAQSGGGEQ